ncbi:MAG: hypothetical protein NCW75_03575 [Phycisphaera sp.]|nr:MAG: hypothetical protein NCW75_03575 [Phycisphaera sp.]
MTTTTQMTFQEHCRETVRELRGALLDMYVQVGADPDKPQDVSRKLELNKNLTWKLSRVMQAEDAFEALPLLPGMAGLDLALDAMAKAGASEYAIERVRSAIAEVDSMVEIHGGDRATMELMLDSMGSNGLEKSRKLAYRGNAGLWGMLAKVRVTAQFIAPSATDPDKLDAVQIAGLHQVRRFRPVPRWPVFRLGRYLVSGESGQFPIEDEDGSHEGMLSSFSRGPMPEIHAKKEGDGLVYEVGDGPVGKTGEFSCYFGFGHRNFVPRYTKTPGETGSLAAAVGMPVETLLFDLFVHKDLREALAADAAVYGGPWLGTAAFPEQAKLPVNERLINLGRGGNLATPLVDQYAPMMKLAFERAGWASEDFYCLRLVVEHPPMPSRAVIRFPLRQKGA